jgi:outer membrane protein OmpA-like peptidoglycan-associated protein
MSALKFTLCAAVATLGLLSVSASAESRVNVPRYSGYHPQYQGMLSSEQKLSLRNYLQYEQREPCQNYKELPVNFYQDGCDLLYRYPSMGSASLERIVLASYVIEFPFDSAAIEVGAEPVLAKIANEINKYHPRDVTVSGYTDSHGAAGYNVGLSQRRADSVSQVLNARGVPNRTLGSQAYGETNQAVHTQDGVALRANRRVIVEFLK